MMSERSELQSSERYYQLTAAPFDAEPATPFFLRSRAHGAALEDLISAARQGAGVIVLTGDPGSGRTAVCHALGQELGDQPFTIVSPDPTRSRAGLLSKLLIDFGVAPEEWQSGGLRGASEADLAEHLSQFVASSPSLRSPVVVLDDAESAEDVAEDLLTLSSLETDDKRLTIVLAGPASLWRAVASLSLSKQRRSVPPLCELGPLTADEVAAYVRHRLAAAGGLVSRLHFSSDALELVAEESGGVPRAVNAMCERAIERAYVMRATTIDRTMLDNEPRARRDEHAAISPAVTAPETGAPPLAPEERAGRPDLSGLDFDFDLASLPPSRTPPIDHRSSQPRARGRLRGSISTRKVLAVVGALMLLAAVGVFGFPTSSPEAPRPVASVPPPATPPRLHARGMAAVVPAVAWRPVEPSAYVIEVATFRRAEGTAALLEQLRALGLTAFDRTLDRGSRGTMQQVLVGPYDAVGAETALTRIRQLPEYRDAAIRRTQQH